MKRELILKEDGQSYAQVTRILGNGNIEAFYFDNTDGEKRLCHIRGKLRKKMWINEGHYSHWTKELSRWQSRCYHEVFL